MRFRSSNAEAPRSFAADQTTVRADRSAVYRSIWLGVGIFLAYLITARLGLSIHPVNTFATFVWPPTGIALASFVMLGYRFWPAVALAAFLVNFWIGASVLVALGIAVGNTLAPLVGAYILQQYIGFQPTVLRLRDNIGLIAIALSVTMISATIGVVSLFVSGSVPTGAFGVTWGAWWIGDTLGILIFAPFIFKWFSWPHQVRTQLNYLELYAALASVAGSSFVLFWLPQTYFAYYIFIPLTWVALRTGPRGTTLSILLVSAIATVGTLLGYGPFATQGLLYLQIFVGTVSVLFLIFAAVVEERKKTLQTFEGQVDELEFALQKISSEDEAKKEFIAVLAHELRNPLAAILSSTELLKLQGADGPDTGMLLETVEERVRTMGTLLDDLLDISRISRKKLKLQKERLALGPIVDRAAHTVQVLIRSRNHTFSITKPADELYLDADPIRIEQIIVNLLNNAAKYTEPGGSIELTVVQEGKCAAVRVHDSGIGIPRNLLARIFEPFFQVEHGKPMTEGLGVGLSLTRQLVEMHGGTIEATSKGKGQGSEFIVRLPLSQESEAPPGKRKTLSGGRGLPRTKYPLNILVVDDNEAATEALGRLLELRGHNVSLAFDGSRAIEKAREVRPQVIILDIGLPDMSGYDVARTLRKEEDLSHILIAVTGYGQGEDKERALQAGFDHHLTKPVGLRELEAILQKVPHLAKP